MKITNLKVPGKHNKPILTDIQYKINKVKKPIVVLCHGYKGFKDWGAWHLVADAFEKQGFFFVKFSFAYNGGTPEQPIDFPDLKAFGKNTFTKELDDVDSVLKYFLSQEDFTEELDESNITLIGHSRGGAIVTLKASENDVIKNVISWAGISDIASRFPTGFKLWWWKIRGVGYVKNARTQQKMPHYFSFYKDFIKNKERLNIKKAIQFLKANHLIIQGTNDVVVKQKEAENLHAWSSKSKLIMIQDMDHALGCTQPYTDVVMPLDLQKVVTHSIEFINGQN